MGAVYFQMGNPPRGAYVVTNVLLTHCL